MSDITSYLPDTDKADGTVGSTSPTTAVQVGGSDGTNLRALKTDSSGNLSVNVNQQPPTLDLLGSGTITALNGTVVISTHGCSTANISVSGTWVATLVIEGQSGDNIWYVLQLGNPAGGINLNTFSTNNLYTTGIGGFTQIRVRASAYTSGTVSITINLSVGDQQTLAVDANGNQQVVGNVAGGSTDSGNAVKIGAVFNSTPPTYSTGQRTDAQSDGRGNLSTADVITNTLSSGSITVGTTAVAARVSSSNLVNRKMLTISPQTGTVYLGSSSSVTTATGIPIFKNQVISFAFSANVTPYLIAASSITVNVMEGS